MLASELDPWECCRRPLIIAKVLVLRIPIGLNVRESVQISIGSEGTIIRKLYDALRRMCISEQVTLFVTVAMLLKRSSSGSGRFSPFYSGRQFR